jgi:hypothetical protein
MHPQPEHLRRPRLHWLRRELRELQRRRPVLRPRGLLPLLQRLLQLLSTAGSPQRHLQQPQQLLNSPGPGTHCGSFSLHGEDMPIRRVLQSECGLPCGQPLRGVLSLLQSVSARSGLICLRRLGLRGELRQLQGRRLLLRPRRQLRLLQPLLQRLPAAHWSSFVQIPQRIRSSSCADALSHVLQDCAAIRRGGGAF